MLLFLNLRTLLFHSQKNRLTIPQLFSWREANTLASRRKNMVQVLNVAEKNDAAKNIADLLSRGRCSRREGRSKFNKIYEFDYNLFNQNVRMAVTSVSGHLLALDFIGNFKSWQAVNPVALFDAPIQKYCPNDYQNIKKTLEEETRKSQYLIIWTDCDREGENIGFEVIQVCQAVKSNIQIYRAKFSEITYQSVSRALSNLERPNKKVSDAVDVRQELDLRIGAAFTRFQTLRLKQVFPQTLGNAMISYGSCQFPTLGFIVERYRSIQEFIREPFWKLKVTWEPNEEEKVEFLWKRHHLFNKNVVQVLLEKCQENPSAEVVKLQTKNKNKWRPVPLDTVELEKLASRKLKISAKETMKTAEKLYTQGYISYPRTETNIFPKEMDLGSLVEMQTASPTWGGFARRVLDEGVNPRQGKKSDQAHPPIHPTKYVADLSNETERKLYEFIVRHFLACVSKDSQGYETVAEIDIQDEGFVASGLQIVARNYLEVYPYERWSDRSLPQLSQGQIFEPTTITMEEGETSPPRLLSEADLIALMEKHGIGTDATHAEHIETIKSRMYAGVQDDGRFLPCSLGMGLVQGYDDMGIALSKPNLRAELESDLKKICDGERNPQDVLKEQIDKYRTVFVQAMEQVTKIDEALAVYLNEERQEARNFNLDTGPQNPIYRKCPSCNLDMVLRRKKDNTAFFFSCMGYPQCKTALWLPHTIQSVSIDERKCSSCPSHPPLLRFTFNPGAYAPFYPDNHVGCIGGCDANFLELLAIRPLTQQSTSQNTAQAHSSTTQMDRSSATSGYASQSQISLTSTNDYSRSSNFEVNDDSAFGSSRTTHSFSNTSGSSRTREQFAVPNRPLREVNQHNNISSSNAGQHSFAPTNNSNRVREQFSDSSQGDSAIVCSCNENAVLLTVRKEGPNTGRQFYKCGKPQGAGNCDFFLWADAANSAPPSQSRGTNEATRRQFHSSRNQSDDGGEVVCGCGEPAKLLTVQKEGPNQGRQFYGCTKPRDSQCGFFQWADEASGAGTSFGQESRGRFGNSNGFDGSGGARPGTRGRGRGRGGKATETSNERKARKCGLCGQEGHTRNRCPQAD